MCNEPKGCLFRAVYYTKLSPRLFPNITVRVIVSLSLPHIFISIYNKTNEQVSNNVNNDKRGEYCGYGNFTRHV